MLTFKNVLYELKIEGLKEKHIINYLNSNGLGFHKLITLSRPYVGANETFMLRDEALEFLKDNIVSLRNFKGIN